MINNATGHVTMLEIGEAERILSGGGPPAGQTLVWGEADEIRRLGRSVALGNRELERRAARRAQQRVSRRRNR